MRFFFFFNDTATTEIYTLSLHDALPIYDVCNMTMQFPDNRIGIVHVSWLDPRKRRVMTVVGSKDRKSTRLNSSHDQISYAVFCLKKKTKEGNVRQHQATTRDDINSIQVT